MNYSFQNLFRVSDGVAKMPFSPGELAKGISKHMDAPLSGLVRVEFKGDSCHQFQVKESDGFTGHDTLIVFLKYHNAIQAIFIVDEGVRANLMASYVFLFDGNKEYDRIYEGDVKNYHFTDDQMIKIFSEAFELISVNTK